MDINETQLRLPMFDESLKPMISKVIGIIGMFFPIAANFIPPSTTRDAFFVIGGVLMLISALIEQELFFSVLQIIVIAGAVMAFTSWSFIARAAVPILLTSAFLVYFALSGRLKDRLMLFGSLGIAILAIGYAVTNPLIYLLGGLILGIYSTFSFRRGVSIALLWAIVNYVFAIAVLINIYRFVLN